MERLRNSLTKILALISLAAWADGPKLTFPDGNDIRLGLIKKDVVVTDSVRITNSGDAPLNVLKVATTCSCTVAGYPHDPVMPGDTVVIKVSFDSHGRSPGGFMKILTVRCDDEKGVYKIYVSGDVARPVRKEWN